ncbi:MAG: type II toxin-antitoxin system HicA family toxin [Acidobacteriota bacterium]|nr:type II toxin-antitoxin system HicA family toxin [Acidobacteriota bacterium]
MVRERETQKTLVAIFTNPVNGGLEWVRIEALLCALGCELVEGEGSAVAFHKLGLVLNVHRPHPQKDALRYRVKAVREFLEMLGETP